MDGSSQVSLLTPLSVTFGKADGFPLPASTGTGFRGNDFPGAGAVNPRSLSSRKRERGWREEASHMSSVIPAEAEIHRVTTVSAH